VKYGDIIQLYACVNNKHLMLKLKKGVMCMVYNTIEEIHLGLDGGLEIQNNMGVSLEELKTSFVELVLVDNP
jgi:hypothetical protein